MCALKIERRVKERTSLSKYSKVLVDKRKQAFVDYRCKSNLEFVTTVGFHVPYARFLVSNKNGIPLFISIFFAFIESTQLDVLSKRRSNAEKQKRKKRRYKIYLAAKDSFVIS